MSHKFKGRYSDRRATLIRRLESVPLERHIGRRIAVIAIDALKPGIGFSKSLRPHLAKLPFVQSARTLTSARARHRLEVAPWREDSRCGEACPFLFPPRSGFSRLKKSRCVRGHESKGLGRTPAQTRPFVRCHGLRCGQRICILVAVVSCPSSSTNVAWPSPGDCFFQTAARGTEFTGGACHGGVSGLRRHSESRR